MAVSIYLENEAHERIAYVGDDPDESFIAVCREASEGSWLATVNPWGDTMFNVPQLEQFVGELIQIPEEQKSAVIRQVADMAQKAVLLRGYLFISGD
ncbi:hypothetical protein ACFVXC_00085 [Streptomyces sp. NPDC058257]|uniref:hypothetical protein n=1 Tax=Streptomyces sp. NPDC058257 TaxID=3346409 RepID=UPI0036E13A69